MTKKHKKVIIESGAILLLLLLFVVVNTLFVTVEVFSYSATWGFGPITSESRLYTLYNNRVLVESRVMSAAEDNKPIRLMQLPTKIKRLSKEDYARVCEWKNALKDKEVELTSSEIIEMSLDGCWYACVYGEVDHYVIPLINSAGANEAVKIENILRTYLYDK